MKINTNPFLIKTMRTSVMTYNEAIKEVKDFFASEGVAWQPGDNYLDNYVVEEGSADCSAFPCPRELDGWDGEVTAFYVYDKDNNELFACASWE